MYIENHQINKNVSIWLISMFWIVSIMIIVGGLTRLTDSGLSITEWQLFSGFLPPLNETEWNNYFNLYKEIPEFKLQNFSMTLQEFKIIFWWEWIHRFLGRLIGLGFLIPLLYFSFKVGFIKLINLYLIFFLICFEGFIGWYMVSSGLIDNVDVRDISLNSLRSMIGVVNQDAFLFSSTLRKNISLGSRNVPLDDIVRAAKLAHIHDFISSLKDVLFLYIANIDITNPGVQNPHCEP